MKKCVVWHCYFCGNQQDDNVLACLRKTYSQLEYDQLDVQ